MSLADAVSKDLRPKSGKEESRLPETILAGMRKLRFVIRRVSVIVPAPIVHLGAFRLIIFAAFLPHFTCGGGFVR